MKYEVTIKSKMILEANSIQEAEELAKQKMQDRINCQGVEESLLFTAKEKIVNKNLGFSK
jgi:hypothetical protein